MTVTEEKAALRRRIKNDIESLPAEYVCQSDKGILKNIISLYEYSNASTLLCYYSVGREVSTAALIKTALKKGKAVALPVSYPHGKMIFRKIEDTDGLELSRFGIPEPAEACPEISPDAGAIIIVPALCFDERLQRLGHGGGYYDRYLDQSGLTSIGLCRENLLQHTVPTDEHDVPVDILITEKRILRK